VQLSTKRRRDGVGGKKATLNEAADWQRRDVEKLWFGETVTTIWCVPGHSLDFLYAGLPTPTSNQIQLTSFPDGKPVDSGDMDTWPLESTVATQD
jgi:hypothetical protein